MKKVVITACGEQDDTFRDYMAEEWPAQFGANPNIVNEWFGASVIKAKPVKYDFLSERDTPMYFCLLDWASKDKYEDAEHMSALEIKEGLDFTAAPGEKVVLRASACKEVCEGVDHMCREIPPVF